MYWKYKITNNLFAYEITHHKLSFLKYGIKENKFREINVET